MKQDRHGFGRNQGVKRLRKPEDAAQPGEANPAQVAARFLERCRGRNPRRVCSPLSRVVQRGARSGERSGTGQTL